MVTLVFGGTDIDSVEVGVETDFDGNIVVIFDGCINSPVGLTVGINDVPPNMEVIVGDVIGGIDALMVVSVIAETVVELATVLVSVIDANGVEGIATLLKILSVFVEANGVPVDPCPLNIDCCCCCPNGFEKRFCFCSGGSEIFAFLFNSNLVDAEPLSNVLVFPIETFAGEKRDFDIPPTPDPSNIGVFALFASFDFIKVVKLNVDSEEFGKPPKNGDGCEFNVCC